MKIRQIVVSLFLGFGLTGCYVADSAYYPDYDEDYIYSVGYYGYRPYDWGDGYYSTYGWGTRDWVVAAPRTRVEYVTNVYCKDRCNYVGTVRCHDKCYHVKHHRHH